MPSSSSSKVTVRVPFVVLLGLMPVAAFALPSCGGDDAVCGDARVEGEEACDDGNTVDDDDCTNACALPKCGDGIVQDGKGEECEDGEDADGPGDSPKIDTDGCTNDCKIDVCGDDVLRDGVEECDDGNLSNTDDCLETCLFAGCGDGFIHLTTTSDPPAELEECDDANDDGTDNCTTACMKPACGDGFVWTGFEDCDDGNATNDDACPACKLPVCGDGFVDPATEECDDANVDDTDGCLTTCATAACGDAILQEGEECDDGNLVSGDFCSETCKRECFGGEVLGDSCYMYFPGPLPWPEANCNAFDSHLVTITSTGENTFVQELIPGDATDAWIGLTDQAVESAWFWQLDQAGEELLFPALLKWAPAQPDDQPDDGADCAIMSEATGLWHDQPCAELRGFICEHEF